MKKLLFLLFLIPVGLALYLGRSDFQSNPKPGEVWRYIPSGPIKNDNPFEGPRTWTYLDDSVIAIKDGYVKYFFVGNTIEFSSSIHNFKLESHKIR